MVTKRSNGRLEIHRSCGDQRYSSHCGFSSHGPAWVALVGRPGAHRAELCDMRSRPLLNDVGMGNKGHGDLRYFSSGILSAFPGVTRVAWLSPKAADPTARGRTKSGRGFLGWTSELFVLEFIRISTAQKYKGEPNGRGHDPVPGDR